MSVDIRKNYRIWISWKNMKEKSLGRVSLLTVTISEPFKYLVFYNRDTSIKLGLL